MRSGILTFTGILDVGAAVLFGPFQGVSAQPAGGPPPGGDRPTDERLGNTSILMGRTPIPASVDGCGTGPEYARLLCLIDLLKESASDDLLSLMQ